MKNLFPQFAKLVAVAACALTLGSCNRAEYAMLPKSSSYAGPRASTPVPAATPAPSVAAEMPATPPTAPAAVTPVAPVSEAPAVAVAKKAAAEIPATSATIATAPAAKPIKLNLVQRLAFAKISKKVEKMTQDSKLNRHANTAATQRLDSDLRTAILLAAIGILVEILGIALNSSLVYILGAVLIIVGAVFFVLWLVNKL